MVGESPRYSLMSMKCIVVLDTSFLLMIADGYPLLDLLREALPHCEIVVPSVVVMELEKISREQSIRSNKARWVLNNIVSKMRIYPVDPGIHGKTDDVLLSIAEKNRFIIATVDMELKKRARVKKIPVAFFRKSKFRVEVEGLYH